MTLWQAAVLGLVQGATEFFPVSSSGHLVVVPRLLGWEAPPVSFDVAVHFGTLVALAGVYWRELVDMVRVWLPGRERVEGEVTRALVPLLLLASVPAGIAGVALKGFVEGSFQRLSWVGGFLLLSGCLAFATERLARGLKRLQDVRWWQALVIGVAQACALMPGLSRSGATIMAGTAIGLDRATAPRFAFLMAFPVMLGATAFELAEMQGLASEQWACYLVGALVAALSGFAAIKLVVAALRRQSFYVFAAYCWVIGMVALVSAQR
ncbi:MAG: undecaprenyl-diphosphate phosphatase [Armatimonadota bacterium]